ncbi:MAG: MmgE/PrpD family protein [Pseudomonadota bacterium]
MGLVIDTLAAHAAATSWDSLPPDVQAQARRVLLDTLGVMLAGSRRPEVARLRERMLAAPPPPDAARLACPGAPPTSPAAAALLNGIAARSIELCEGHRLVSCQAAAQVLPAALAMAEARQASGRDLLVALVVGYDIAVRLGAGLHARALAHQNGQTALLGAAAAAARLRGLDAAGIGEAMRIAAPLLMVPSYTLTAAGATALNVAGGMSNHQGLLAAELAASGFTGGPDAIEESLAHLTGDGFDPAPVTEALGTRWEITRNHFRVRACCNPIYASLDAIELALAELGHPAAEAIDRIEVQTYRFASLMRAQQPVNDFAARYSLPHAAAAIVLLGHAGNPAFTPEHLADPRFAALRSRVTVAEDPALTARVPLSKPGRATIVLHDGRQATHAVESARGDYNAPLDENALRGKFRSLAGEVLPAQAVDALERLVDRAQDWPRAADWSAPLRD